MPNRILKESIRTSKSVNAMSDFQFRLWVYLITYVDDYGRGSADPEILKGFVFPRRKGVSEQTIKETLAELASKGSVILYEVGGEPYFCFPNWSDHQTVRNKVSKFPSPESGKITSESNCNQMISIESNCPRNPIQSNPIQNTESRIQNPESNPEAESDSEVRARAQNAAAIVQADYLNRVNATPSPTSLDELAGYAEQMGVDVCKRAIDIALDEKKASWSYIRAILRDKLSNGVKCLADWDELDRKREKVKNGKKTHGGKTISTGNCQPSAESIRKSADWLDDFLKNHGSLGGNDG